MNFRRLMKSGVCVTVFVNLCGLACAQEWTRFRGPDGTGMGKGKSIPVTFAESSFLWKIKLPGPGHSSPVLWGHRVFVTCTHDTDNEREILCYDARTGKQLWSKRVPFTPYRHNRLNSFAASTPAVDAKRVYVNWISGETFVALALDHRGDILWQREMGEFSARHGAGASPIALGGLMIIGNDNKATSFLTGLNGSTGDPVWRVKRNSAMTSYATPVVYRAQGGNAQVIFVSESHGMTGIDPASGEKVWETEKLFRLKSVSLPVVAGNIVFATAGSGGAGKESAAVRLDDSLPLGYRPEVAWQLKRDLPYVPTPIAIGAQLYVLSDAGVMTCVQASTGEQVWQADLDARFYASPVCVNGRIYLVTRNGEMIVLKAGNQYQLLARNALPEKSDATPAIANGCMYIRTLNHLMCVGDHE